MRNDPVMKSNRSFILCATDFSSRASEAASVAAKLAQRSSQKLLLVHATDDRRASVLSVLRSRLETAVQNFSKTGVDVEATLLQGSRPSEALLTFIRDREPSLVVVGCGLKGPMDRWALGS